jgi:folate-dependent tRNA-U54 methylase TrmFO/GidA
MVFADGKSRSNWKWAGVKVVPVSEDEKDKFKNEKFRADMTTLKHFEERDFMDALSYIEVIP